MTALLRRVRGLRYATGLSVAMVLSFLLCLPALRLGFYGDERMQLAALEGRPIGSLRPFDLYRFYSGEPAEIARLVHDGQLPWWTTTSFKMAFLRPIASALLGAEHAVFGRNATLYHAVSLLVWLLLIPAVGLLFRRVLSPYLAALAIVVFALHAGHWESIGLVCARHFLLAAIPSSLGVVAYLRYREDGFRPGLALASLCFMTGLAAGEAALQALALILAYELLGARDPVGKRLRAIAPLAALAVGYVILHHARGHGAYALGERYIDPLVEPRRALGRAFTVARLALSLFDGYPGASGSDVPFPVRYDSLLYSLRWPLVLGVAAGGAGVLAVLGRCPESAVPQRDVRAARWLLLGSFLALAPIVGAMPGTRLLLIPSIGVAPVIVVLVAWAWAVAAGSGPAGAARRWAAGAFVVLATVLHFGVSPVLLSINLMAFGRHLARYDERLAAVVRSCSPAPAPGDDVVLLSTPMQPNAAEVGDVLPGSRPWMVLSSALVEQEILRVAPDAFELTVRGIPASPPSATGHPRLGMVVPLRGIEVTAIDVAGGGNPAQNVPRRIRVRAERSLDDPTLWFLAWRNGALRRVEMPAVGERLVLPAIRSPRAAGPP